MKYLKITHRRIKFSWIASQATNDVILQFRDNQCAGLLRKLAMTSDSKRHFRLFDGTSSPFAMTFPPIRHCFPKESDTLFDFYTKERCEES